MKTLRLPSESSPRPARRASGDGFALVIVLWVLAGLTVVAVAVAASARVGNEATKLLRDRVNAEAAFMSTAARIQVIASTSRSNFNGYEGLRGRLFLDGRLTEIGAGEQVILQDSRGLVNLNNASTQQVRQLLVQCGVNAADANALADALEDYIDIDDLKRLNGAEAFDYRLRGGLPPPRNAPLLSREELWRIQGWPDIRRVWDERGCSNEVITQGTDSGYNQNTATLSVMLSNGVERPIAQGILETRSGGIMTGQSRVEGDPNDFFLLMRTRGRVGETMRIRHSLPLIEWELEYALELTPSRPGGPWRLHEVRYVGKTPFATKPALTAKFPPVDYSPSEQERTQSNAPPALPFGN